MAKLGYPEILSIVAYLVALIPLLFPEVSSFLLSLPINGRIGLLFAMFVVPALPVLLGRRHTIYSAVCGFFRVSNEEMKLLGIFYANLNKNLSTEDFAHLTGINAREVDFLLDRLERRGLLIRSQENSGGGRDH